MIFSPSPITALPAHTITVTQLAFLEITGGCMRCTNAGGFVPPQVRITALLV